MVDHEKDLEEQNLKHSQALQEEQTNNNRREEKLKNEIEFLKTSFHSYKVKCSLHSQWSNVFYIQANLEKENEEKNQVKMNEILETTKKEMIEKEEEINKRLNEAIAKERKSLNARQRMEMENLRKQHQKEIEVIE